MLEMIPFICSYVFGNPESFLANHRVRQVLRQPSFRKQVVCLVFDEVHTAVSWYVKK